MTNSIKRLAGQTAIYGLSSIVGRLLNYLLVPVYTNYFLTHEFGVIAEMYSYVAILIVILTHGMETAFFRFAQQDEKRRETIFSTALLSVLLFSAAFLLFTITFRQDISEWMRYPDHPEYIWWFALIIGLDAFSAIPFARLRAENRPVFFAVIKLAGIGINITLVLFFVIACPFLLEADYAVLTPFVKSFYNPETGVGYVFIANLVASSFTSALLIPVTLRQKIHFSPELWRKMILYALPLLIAGLAGIINEALDKILLKYLLPEEIAMSHLGIYGASYRVSVLMILFIQAFRFAAEPFFFAEYKNSQSREIYARVMNVFVITCLFIFMGIMMYMDIIQYFIGKNFREGLDVVPILLMAHIFLGIYFNLSIWYKLTGQTHYGAIIAIMGATITILINVWLIPVMGYHASAWAHLFCYFSMVVISWYWGRKHFPVPYNIKKIFLLILSALALYFVHSQIPIFYRPVNWVISAFFLAFFAISVWLIDAETRHTLKPFFEMLRKKFAHKFR